MHVGKPIRAESLLCLHLVHHDLMALKTICVPMAPPVWTLLELQTHLCNRLPGICTGIARRCFEVRRSQTVILIFCTPAARNGPFFQLLGPESLRSPLTPQHSHPTSRPSASPTWLCFQNMFPNRSISAPAASSSLRSEPLSPLTCVAVISF